MRNASGLKRNAKLLGQPDNSGNAGWLITFNDMVTLLMTFFILIIAMSDMDTAKIGQITQAIHETFGIKSTHNQDVLTVHEQNGENEATAVRREEELSGLEIEIASLQGAEVRRDAGGITVTMGEKTLFDQGSATLMKDGQSMLMPFIAALGKNEMLIHVEGHTDSQPITSVLFPSNWELSVARAVSVVMFLEENGIAANRLSVVGYGDTKPVAENQDLYGRQKNRRVEIKLTYRG